MKSAKDYFMEERENEMFETRVPIRRPSALTKKEITAQATAFAEKMLEGTNPLDLIVDLKRLEEYLLAMKTVVQSRIKDFSEPQEINRAKVEMIAGRMGWDFSHSEKWKELSQALTEYEGLMKKAAETPGYTIIDENGEVVPPAVHKPGKPFLKITL